MKAKENWSRKPPHLLTSPVKCSGVWKEASRKIGSGVASWLVEGGAGVMPGEETDKCS